MNEILFIARSVTHAQRMVRALSSAASAASVPGPGGAYRQWMQLCGEGGGQWQQGGPDVSSRQRG